MKGKKIMLLVGMIGMAPLVLLGCLFLFNMVNPMQWAFITSFEVVNQSGQDIWITPVGTRGTEGRKGRLPMFMLSVPSVPAIRSGGFNLKDGRTIRIRYDWDDVNFSEIAVKDKDGQLHELLIDPNPTVNQYHPSESSVFTIPPLETLPVCRESIVSVVHESDLSWMQFILTVGGFVPIFIFLRIQIAYKKLNPIDVREETTNMVT